MNEVLYCVLIIMTRLDTIESQKQGYQLPNTKFQTKEQPN
jgi:hypothetical protein